MDGQEATGEGSSVDDHTDDLKKSSLADDESKQKKVNDENSQAAASDSVKCPRCGTSFKLNQPEVGEEMKECYQIITTSSNQDWACEEQMQVAQKDLWVLKELERAVSQCFKYAVDAERLKDCINKTSIDPKDLLQFVKHVNALHQKCDKGNSSSSSSRFWTTIVKVHLVTTGQTFGAHNVILEYVRSKKNMLQTVETTDLQECDIIIVFCPITSRVGSDVEAAMRNITGDKPVILVLMHHTRDVDYSTDVKRWSEIYKNVVLDVHVLFHETQQGLLTCPRNNQAVQQIQKVLSKHSKLRWPLT